MIFRLLKLLFCSFLGALPFSSCKNNTDDHSDEDLAAEVVVQKISPEMAIVRDYVMDHAVIAHRGSTFWVPEETEAAFRWARNIGADYLEIDVQRTKDGVLLALHDNNLQRTTNISMIFPDRKDNYVSDFTFEELLQLDAGSWFNKAHPEQARASFVGQQISTLEDVIRIAEGKRVARNLDGSRKYTKNPDGTYTFEYELDPADNGNRPGVYIETKEPSLFEGIEQDLYNELNRLGRNIITQPVVGEPPFFKDNKVNTGNTKGKIILQTFSSNSLINLNNLFKGQVPTCFLLWLGDAFLRESDSPENYAKALNFAIQQQAHFTGPSIEGAPNNYKDLLKLWQAQLTHRTGLKIHAYSFDTRVQMEKYYGLEYGKDANGNYKEKPLADAMFTNRSELTINFYKEMGVRPLNIMGNNIPPTEILNQLGY